MKKTSGFGPKSQMILSGFIVAPYWKELFLTWWNFFLITYNSSFASSLCLSLSFFFGNFVNLVNACSCSGESEKKEHWKFLPHTISQ